MGNHYDPRDDGFDPRKDAIERGKRIQRAIAAYDPEELVRDIRHSAGLLRGAEDHVIGGTSLDAIRKVRDWLNRLQHG